jgi:glycosyltransferase involved in cell wall biosynthesis
MRPGPVTGAEPLPFVSVIVPVYNDVARLTSCLAALERQTYPRDRYEIVVVDNGSTDSLEPALAASRRARLVHEPRPGSYAARNAGLAVARGPMLAFTDSDCLPSASWIARGVEAFSSTPNCGLVGGRIEVFFREPGRPTAVELFSSIILYGQRRYLESEHYSVTANSFSSRAVFEHVGPFDPILRSSGDLEWGRRVFAAGYQQVYAEHAVVLHPATYSLRELSARIARMAGGKYDLRSRDSRSVPGLLEQAVADCAQYLSYIGRIATDPRPRHLRDKLRVYGVLLFTQHLVLGERLRLHLGGTPRR